MGKLRGELRVVVGTLRVGLSDDENSQGQNRSLNQRMKSNCHSFGESE